ncbi:hypothetical protein L1987_27616 [Smallanthus sonchifolius]|uniref:Uncharacterized protein n=1 Tax=Smallanthus sonchifolius TaxID=185202 RepID=A0ACB9IBE6_9ASTR|nr:hypothetical protein L1987_27616 [Smallanthus sonchifolius]
MAEMHHWDKEKSRRNKQKPSFSSSLLDEIYRSIDGGDEKFGEFKLRKPKVETGSGGGRLKSKTVAEDEGFRRVEKWMGNETVRGPCSLQEFDQKLVLDNDPLFFSSGSSSSDSSFGWYSEAEAVKPKPSCFAPLNRVKTSSRSGFKKQNDCDDDQTDDSGLIRSKALKMYASLKSAKQPISSGGRLTTFISAIFTNAHSKKSEERKSKSTNVSTCSSATSFSRSCLNKNPPPPTTFPWPRMEKPNLNEFLRKYNDKKMDDLDDVASDSSSDLFELDHLAMFKNDKYCEELPVYETTHMGTNRAIASGLVC